MYMYAWHVRNAINEHGFAYIQLNACACMPVYVNLNYAYVSTAIPAYDRRCMINYTIYTSPIKNTFSYLIDISACIHKFSALSPLFGIPTCKLTYSGVHMWYACCRCVPRSPMTINVFTRCFDTFLNLYVQSWFEGIWVIIHLVSHFNVIYDNIANYRNIFCDTSYPSICTLSINLELELAVFHETMVTRGPFKNVRGIILMPDLRD